MAEYMLYYGNKKMATIGQYLIFPVVWILSKIFLCEVVFHGEEHFRDMAGKPAILIANHISLYDSFLLRLSSHWKRLHVYFMGVTKFNIPQMQWLWNIGIIPIVYKLFGVFTVIPGKGLDKNLMVPKAILSRGDAVFIFPEGSINTSGTLMPFKKGAAVLAISTGVPIIPIGFRVINKSTRRSIIISIGEPITFSSDSDSDVVSRQLEVRIGELVTVEQYYDSTSKY